MSLNYIVRKNEVRKVNEGNEMLLKQLRDAQPTLRVDDWLSHERRVASLRHNIAGKQMMLPVLPPYLRGAHNRSFISDGGGSRTLDQEQHSIETLKQQSSLSPVNNTSNSKNSRSVRGGNAAAASFNATSSVPKHRGSVRRTHRRGMTAGGPRRKYESSDRELLKNIMADDLIKKYNAAELEKVFNQFHSEQFYARFRSGKRASEKTQSSSATGSALTALQIQEAINQNRPGLFSQGGGERSPRYHHQIRASSHSPNFRPRLAPDPVSQMLNTKRPPATAIGSQRVVVFPGSPSSMDSSSAGGGGGGQRAVLLSHHSKASRGSRGACPKPTSPSNISVASNSCSQSPNNSGYPKNHLLPKSTPGLSIPLRNQKPAPPPPPSHGTLLQNWPIQEEGRKLSAGFPPPASKGSSASQQHQQQERDSIVSRGSAAEQPRGKTSSGAVRAKAPLPLAKRIVTQKAKGGKVKIDPSLMPPPPALPTPQAARKKSPIKNNEFPSSRKSYLCGGGHDRINTSLLERVSPGKQRKTTTTTLPKPTGAGVGVVVVVDPSDIPLRPLNEMEVNRQLFHQQENKVATPLPESDDLSDFKDMPLKEREAQHFISDKKLETFAQQPEEKEKEKEKESGYLLGGRATTQDTTSHFKENSEAQPDVSLPTSSPLIKVEEKDGGNPEEYSSDGSEREEAEQEDEQQGHEEREEEGLGEGEGEGEGEGPSRHWESERVIESNPPAAPYSGRTEIINSLPSPKLQQTERTEFESVQTSELMRFEEKEEGEQSERERERKGGSSSKPPSVKMSTSKLSGGVSVAAASDETNTINDATVPRMKRDSTDLLHRDADPVLEGQPIAYEQVEYKPQPQAQPQAQAQQVVEVTDSSVREEQEEEEEQSAGGGSEGSPLVGPEQEKNFAIQASFEDEYNLKQIDETSEENILSSQQTRNVTPAAALNVQQQWQQQQQQNTTQYTVESSPRHDRRASEGSWRRSSLDEAVGGGGPMAIRESLELELEEEHEPERAGSREEEKEEQKVVFVSEQVSLLPEQMEQARRASSSSTS